MWIELGECIKGILHLLQEALSNPKEALSGFCGKRNHYVQETGFDPRPRKVPHDTEQLSPCTGCGSVLQSSGAILPTEAHALQLLPSHTRAVLRHKRSRDEARALQLEYSPLGTTREKAMQQGRPSATRN